MARLIRARAARFRAFPTLDWTPPEKGLYLLDGECPETGRCNFVGKSTLLDLPFWTAYGWLPKWGGPKGGQADGVVQRGEKSCWGDCEWRAGQRLVRVRRSRPSRLEAWVDGAPVESKDVQRAIEEHLGSPARYLRETYLSQNRQEEAATKSFYTMGDAERTDLLSAVANLERLDKALAEAKAERDSLERDITALGGKLEAQRARLEELPDVVARRQSESAEAALALVAAGRELEALLESQGLELKGLEGDAAEAMAAADQACREALDSMSPQLAALASRYRQLEAELASSPKPEPELAAAVDREGQAFTLARFHNARRASVERENEKLSERMSRLADEAERAQSGKCGECGQDLPEWDRERAAADKLAKAEELAKSIRDVPEPMDESDRAYQAAVAALAARKAELDAQPARLRAEMATQKALKAKLDAEMAAARQAAAAERGRLRVGLESARREAEAKAEQARRGVKSLSDRKGAAERELDGALAEQGRVVASISETEEAIGLKARELDGALDRVELFGPKGCRTAWFDGLVDRIGTVAGQLLGLQTDGLYSVRLSQAATDSKGNSKAVLRPEVTKGGVPVLADDPSGGLRQHIVLAFDVAVSQATAEGSPLFLDEALDGLDEQGKEAAMEMLAEVARTRLVVVVDHASEMKSSFTNLIRVVHSKGVSTLEGTEDDGSAVEGEA